MVKLKEFKLAVFELTINVINDSNNIECIEQALNILEKASSIQYVRKEGKHISDEDKNDIQDIVFNKVMYKIEAISNDFNINNLKELMRLIEVLERTTQL